jgi:hypothetical protein
VDCYGQTKSSGFEARDEMNRNYGKITDDDLTRLSSKYSFSYALLFSYTKSDFPVVLAQGKYKLVSLAGN